jgi:LacI family transcriptional regulator
MICELTHPPMSSIALNFEEAGYEAAAQLDRQMKGKKAAIDEIHLRPMYIHTRQSTDVLAVENPAVAEALRFIRIHAGDVLTVEDVVEAASTSRRLLERHFRRAVGAGIYQEIQRAHIERASRMLVETNWSLADVAQQCGFSNPVHFSVAFKRQRNLTPEQHRRGAAKPIPDPSSALQPPVRPSPRGKVTRRTAADVAKSKDKDAKSNSPGAPFGRK